MFVKTAQTQTGHAQSFAEAKRSQFTETTLPTIERQRGARPVRDDKKPRELQRGGTSRRERCCPATNGARRHGQRKSWRSARRHRARNRQGFASFHQALRPQRSSNPE